MSLTFGPAPPELAGELTLVRRQAEALARALEAVNALPADFPKSQLIALTSQLVELPSASAATAWHALELADTRLPELRSAHFPPEPPPGGDGGDRPPTPARGEGVDRELSDLITAVSTALRVARRLAAIEPERQPPDPSVDRPADGELAAAEAKGERAAREIDAARSAFDDSDPPASPAADDFRRALTDARVLTGLGRVELAQRQIIPAWLKRLGRWLAEVPERIAQAGRALKIAVETTRGIHGVWRSYSRKIIDVHYDSVAEFAEEMEKTSQRLGAKTPGRPDEAFSLSKMRAKLIAGEPLPKSWVSGVDELDLRDTPLRDLSNFEDLTSLRRLDLSYTKVADLSPLKALTALQSLSLNYTQVSDLSPLKALTALQSLSLHGTQVADLSPLSALTALQSLSLDNKRVADFSPLSALTALQSLSLERTQVADLSPLKALTALQSLSLNSTQVADLAPLKALTALQSLSLHGTQVADLSPLKALTALQSLSLNFTEVADLSPLKALTALQSLSLDNTKVADLSPLKAMTALQSLSLNFTQVADLSPLRDLAALEILYMHGAKVTDVSVLAHLPKLYISGGAGA